MIDIIANIASILGFTMQMNDKFFAHGMNRHRRKFDIKNDIFKIEKSSVDNNKLVLTINRQPIGEWFKEQDVYKRQGRYDADIKAQLEVTQKLSKPLNEAYNRYDSIGYRVHTAAEEKHTREITSLSNNGCFS